MPSHMDVGLAWGYSTVYDMAELNRIDRLIEYLGPVFNQPSGKDLWAKRKRLYRRIKTKMKVWRLANGRRGQVPNTAQVDASKTDYGTSPTVG